MIVNPFKTKALVVSRSIPVIPSNIDLVLSVVSILPSPNLDILCIRFDSKLTFKVHVHGFVSCVSQRICILRLAMRVFVDTSVVLRCYYAFGLSNYYKIIQYYVYYYSILIWYSDRQAGLFFVLVVVLSILTPLFLPCVFLILFHSCCSQARVFWETLVHEFLIPYSHTEWYFISRQCNYKCRMCFRAKK